MLVMVLPEPISTCFYDIDLTYSRLWAHQY